MRAVELTYGESLGIAVTRWLKKTTTHQTDLFEAVGRVAECSVNTIGALLELEQLPPTGGTGPDGKRRGRLYLLLLVVDEDPTEWGLNRDDLPTGLILMTDEQLRDLVRSHLRCNTTWNPPSLGCLLAA